MFANQIEIAGKTTVVLTKTPIDASILQSAEDSASELWMWKQVQDHVVVDIGRCDIPISPGIQGRRDRLSRVNHLVRKRERVERICVFTGVSFCERGMSGPQSRGSALVSSKLNLAGGMRRQDFVEPEV